MSEKAGWGDPVELKPVASSPVPTVEAQIARMHGRARDHRSARAESPFVCRVSPRRNPWPEVVVYDARARAPSQRVATLNDEIAAREEARRNAAQAGREP